MGSYFFIDWKANVGLKSKLILFFFRVTSFLKGCPFVVRVICFPFFGMYKMLVEWILCCEIPISTNIGSPLILHHGQGLVINPNVKIGSGCILRHNTTLGSRYSSSDAPVIGNNVDIGCHVVILGQVQIGDNAIIGAGSVVLTDVPSGAVYVGNPARQIKAS